MKNVISCLIGLFLLSSCACGDKEPMPTFGEQLEGNWRAFAYKFNGEEIFIWPDDTYLVDFWDFDGQQGKTKWTRQTGGSLTDTGTYSILAEERNVQIKWDNGGVLGGGGDSVFTMKIDNDTLTVSGRTWYPEGPTVLMRLLRK